ncbi:hypothetical protein [Haloarcula pellucida]|uniref:Uncharacterized protein n=1 Tax=Haloarcula pellucida TaxID=1427151 RepID=A0A830GM99_9EURY|nr:hypothetical protein [Halomicroarcula pellucida]MBX0348062.1 hypothetical protein [Halomicroarcula pellucida]GGN96731.1 hypothetical protein GCM10009030_25350 [Halomicroarcula pellucida]
MKSKLPAVHLTFSELEEIEEILVSQTTQPRLTVSVKLDPVAEISAHSIRQFSQEDIDSFGVGYSIEVSGDEGTIKISGAARPYESHQMHSIGDSIWVNEIETQVLEYFDERKTNLGRIRTYIADEGATTLSIFLALLVGYQIVSVTPGKIIHYYPTVQDSVVFILLLSTYLSVRFRDWIFPYIRISGVESVSPFKRLKEIFYASVFVTALLILVRSIIGPGPTIVF